MLGAPPVGLTVKNLMVFMLSNSDKPDPVTLRLDTSTQAARPGDSRIVDFLFRRARKKWATCSLELKQDRDDPNVWYLIGIRRIIDEVRTAIDYLNRTPCEDLVDAAKGFLDPQELRPDELPEVTIRIQFEKGKEEPISPWLGLHPMGVI